MPSVKPVNFTTETPTLTDFSPWVAIGKERKVTVSNFLALYDSKSATLTSKIISAVDNTISNIGSANVVADLITGFAEDTNPSLVQDFVLTFDFSASALKKVLLSNLPSGDNLGNHTATTSLKMAGNNIENTGNIELVEQTTPSTPVANRAKLYSYDRAGRTALRYLTSTALEIQLAQDNILVCRNQSGVTINKGEAVYISGSQANDRPRITKAQADSLVTMPVLGIAVEDITNTTDGWVMISGKLDGLNTSGFSENDILYVSHTVAGALTTAKPTLPGNYPQVMARVISSHPSTGSILIVNTAMRGNQEGTDTNEFFIGNVAGGGGNRLITLVNSTGQMSLIANPTATRSITFPDTTGTVALVGDPPSSHTHLMADITDLDPSTIARTNIGNVFSLSQTVRRDGAAGGWIASSYFSNVNGAQFIGESARGTFALPEPVNANDFLYALIGRGYHSGGAFSGTVGSVAFRALEAFTATNQGTDILLRTTPIGSTTIQNTVQISSATTSYIAGHKVTFNPNTTNVGINIGSVAGDPSSLINGDIWYDSTGNKFRARQNGISVDIIGGGGATVLNDLTDVTITTPSTGHFLRKSAGNWVNTFPVLADVSDVTITATNLNILDDGADTTLHFHASDRNRANHTGTQLKATISDFAHTHPLSEVSDVTITATNLNILDDGLDTTLHFHASDRARANHTGTQLLSTISDVSITSTNLNILDDGVDTTLHFHAADRARANHTGTQLLSTISDLTITATNLNILDDGLNTTLHFHDSDRARANHTGTQALSTIVAFPISKGGTVLDPAATARNIIAWRAPFACTVTNVRGYRTGGSAASINARRNGASNHLASNLSLTSADTWLDGGAVQNTAYVAGDKLEIMIISTAGNPTEVAIQVDYTRP